MLIAPGQDGEPIELLGPAKRSEYGALMDPEVIATIDHCVVYPAGDTTVSGAGFVHGDISKYQVLAPPGTTVKEGQQIRIRGSIFTVDYTPFDYTVGRRPALARHRPKVSFTASRGDAHDHLG